MIDARLRIRSADDDLKWCEALEELGEEPRASGEASDEPDGLDHALRGFDLALNCVDGS